MVDDWLPPLPDPGAVPRILTRQQAIGIGIAEPALDARVTRGAWQRLLPRTYFTGKVVSDRDRLSAAVAYAGRGAALTGRAALYAAGVRTIAMPQQVLVLVPPTNCAVSHGWVTVRRTVRPFVTERWLHPSRVEPARATADVVVQMRHLDDVRALVARVVQDQHCTIAQLGAELDSGPRRGSKHFRQALREVGWGAASAPEARAADIFRRHGVSGFEANFELTLPNGAARVVDFCWSRLRAVLEIDSVEWHSAVEDWSGTWDRHLDIAKLGYSVIHRPPSALYDEDRFVSDVRAWLAGREADLRLGLPSR